MATAVLGGTVEVIGGGKFANGAISGVYIMMLNHMGDDRPMGHPDDAGLVGGQTNNLSDLDPGLLGLLEKAGVTLSLVENGLWEAIISDFKHFEKLASLTSGDISNHVAKVIQAKGALYFTAKAGGAAFFLVEAGINFKSMWNDPSFSNILERGLDTFFSGAATFGGWPGIAAWGLYQGGKLTFNFLVSCQITCPIASKIYFDRLNERVNNMNLPLTGFK